MQMYFIELYFIIRYEILLIFHNIVAEDAIVYFVCMNKEWVFFMSRQRKRRRISMARGICKNEKLKSCMRGKEGKPSATCSRVAKGN